MGIEPRFIRPTAEPADRAIVVGDPGRAMMLAQELLEPPPLMFNHHRGLWGYGGTALADGRRLIVQATGIGGTSTDAVVRDLLAVGVESLVRVGSCVALGDTPVGATIVVGSALPLDPAARTVHGSGTALTPDPRLTALLTDALATEPAAVASTGLAHARAEAGDFAVADMSTAALLATATEAGARAASVLVAATDATGARELDDAQLEAAFRAAAAAATVALGDG